MRHVSAFWLVGPHEVRSAHAREHYRIEHSAQDLEPVKLIPASGLRPAVASSSGAGRMVGSFSAVVSNISGGGIGVVVPACVGHRVAAADTYRCILHLPTMQVPIELAVEVMHVNHRDDGSRYIGFRIQCDGKNTRQWQSLDNVVRYATWYQRRRLQARRGRAG